MGVLVSPMGFRTVFARSRVRILPIYILSFFFFSFWPVFLSHGCKSRTSTALEAWLGSEYITGCLLRKETLRIKVEAPSMANQVEEVQGTGPSQIQLLFTPQFTFDVIPALILQLSTANITIQLKFRLKTLYNCFLHTYYLYKLSIYTEILYCN